MTVMQRLHRAIEAQVYRQALRDVANRLRYGDRAPVSAMAVYPRPRDITHAYRPPAAGPHLRRQHSGLVKGGDWDRHRQDLSDNTKLVSCRMRWVDGAEWEETPVFRRMVDEIAQGHAPDGCRTRDELVQRYLTLDAIFEQTRARGRMLDMSELPGEFYRRAHGATLVHVGHDGACLRSGGGAHRFAIAHILDLPEMPAQLGVIHPDAIAAGHLERLRMSRFAPRTARGADPRP